MNQDQADALALMQNLNKLNEDDPTRMVSPEHMALLHAAFEKAGIPPEALMGKNGEGPAPLELEGPAGSTPGTSPGAVPVRTSRALLEAQERQARQAHIKGRRQLKGGQVKGAGHHREESKTEKFMQMLETVLKPAFNAYDQKEAAQAQVDLMTERLHGEQQRTRVAGAVSTASVRSMRLRAQQVRRTLTALAGHLGFDPTLFERRTTKADGNWLLRLHGALYDAAPSCFTRVYRTLDQAVLRRLPASASEAELVDRHADGGFAPLRSRGLIPAFMTDAGAQLLLHPLTHGTSFAVPSEEALQLVAQHAPLVECGAGTGYWSAMLQLRGVDILSYDVAPPTDEHANGFFFAQFTEVRAAEGAALFAEQPALAARRALLIVWPNNPEAAGERSQPEVWDTDCLESYLCSGGRTVIYVGEREAEVKVVGGAAADTGTSSTRDFQSLLSERMELVTQLSIPTWKPWHADDLTVWRVKGDAGPPPLAEPAKPSKSAKRRANKKAAAKAAAAAGDAAAGAQPGAAAKAKVEVEAAPVEPDTSSEDSLRLEDGPAEDPAEEDPAEERRRAEAAAAVRSDPSAAPPASLESPPAGWPSVFSSSKELKSFMGKRGVQGKRCRLTEEATEEQRRAVTAAGAELGADSFENAQAAAAALGWAVVTGYAVFGEGSGESGPWCAHPRAWSEKPSGTWIDLTSRAPGMGAAVLLESALATRPDAVE